jgi:hypothetical protein
MSLKADLYYSKLCKYCNSLLNIINDNNIGDLFILKCVDDMHRVDLSNLNIKSVPTIRVLSNNKTFYYENEIAFVFVNKNIEVNSSLNTFDITQNIPYSRWYKNIADYENEPSGDLSMYKTVKKDKCLYVPDCTDNTKLSEHQMKMKLNQTTKIRVEQEQRFKYDINESIKTKLKTL